MLIDALNWLWILLTAYLTGYVLLWYAGKLFCSKQIMNKDVILAAGTVFLTVFSEICSLFMGVRGMSTLVLALVCAGCFLVFRKEMYRKAAECMRCIRTAGREMKPGTAAAVILVFILFILFLSRSAMQPSSYDDYLYHAQAVEWIERYGVVPGLGNLHSRLAYNSAFLCLQALFSWKWLTGQSLHTINSLYAFLLSSYCVTTLSFMREKDPMDPAASKEHGWTNGIRLSDLLKAIALVYLFYDLSALTGLDTDPLAMMTVIYIFIKYAELLERNESSPIPYGLLAVLAVYACTLKLSAGALILLEVFPLIKLIREKKGRQILYFMLTGIAVMLPYLIRNVIISGYLLYPMNAIDLFPVDWKMPVYKLVEDRQGIQIWGRSLNGLLSEGKSWAEVAAMSLTQWFPIWFRSISHIQQLLLLLACAAAADFLFHLVLHVIRRTIPDGCEFLLFAGVGCFAFWLFSAPLIRYGSLYMMIVVGCWIGVYHKKGSRVLLYLWGFLLAVELSHLPAGFMVRPADYCTKDELTESTISAQDGSTIAIYVPVNGDQTDYAHFPTAPSADGLKDLKLRGNDIRDGFQAADRITIRKTGK